MKKIISAALAAAATLSVSAVAFADDPATTAPVEVTVEDVKVDLSGDAGINEVLAAVAANSDLKTVTKDMVKSIKFVSATAYVIYVKGVALPKIVGAPAARDEADWSAGTTFVEEKDINDFKIEGPEDLVFDEIVVEYAAPKEEGNGSNPGTGIALAMAPAALAAAFVGVAVVVSKKKKG